MVLFGMHGIVSELSLEVGSDDRWGGRGRGNDTPNAANNISIVACGRYLSTTLVFQIKLKRGIGDTSDAHSNNFCRNWGFACCVDIDHGDQSSVLLEKRCVRPTWMWRPWTSSFKRPRQRIEWVNAVPALSKDNISHSDNNCNNRQTIFLIFFIFVVCYCLCILLVVDGSQSCRPVMSSSPLPLYPPPWVLNSFFVLDSGMQLNGPKCSKK